MQPIQQ